MTEVEPGQERPFPTLSYSAPLAKDPRAKWVLPGYSIGFIGAGLIQGVILGAIERARAMPGDSLAGLSALVEIVAISFMFGLLPGNILLGLAMWVKKKIFRDVRFARTRWAILAGVLAAALPLPAFALEGLTLAGLTTIGRVEFIVSIAWYLVVPVIAGLTLCYRSALRD